VELQQSVLRIFAVFCGVSASSKRIYKYFLHVPTFRYYQNEMDEKPSGDDLEKRFRDESNGAVFARIIDVIRDSFRIEQMQIN
jgi:hypothetical protein